MNSIKTDEIKAQRNSDECELYYSYLSDNNNSKKKLEQLISENKHNAVWDALCALQHNFSVTKKIEKDISNVITQKQLTRGNESYTVTLYFLPITLITSPVILSNQHEHTGANGLALKPVLPQKQCAKIANILNKHLKLDKGEELSLLSGLLERELIAGSLGIEFIDGLSDRLAHSLMTDDNYESVIDWMVSYNALPQIELTSDYPEDHRVAILYSLTKNNNLNSKIHKANTLVLPFLDELTHIKNNQMFCEIQSVLNEVYDRINTIDNKPSIVASTLPLQTFAFLRLTFCANTILGAVLLSEKVWGKIKSTTINIKTISEYLIKIQAEINISGRGVFSVTQSFESTYRYYGLKEIEAVISCISEQTKINKSIQEL